MEQEYTDIRCYTQSMKLIFIISFIISTTSSCYFLGIRDTSNDKPIKSLAQLNNLTGTWKASAGTYDLLKQKKYKVDSMSLVFHKDSTFVITNLPDCIMSGMGEPNFGKLYKVAGKWNVQLEDDRYWVIKMAFDKSELFKRGLYTDFDLAIVDSTYQLYHYLGDPDQAEAIRFEKPL